MINNNKTCGLLWSIYFSVFLLFISACANDTDTSPKNSMPVPEIVSFTAAQNSITSGTSTTLLATFKNGSGSIDNGFGEVISGQPISVIPIITTTFTLSVTNENGDSVSQKLTITVEPAPTIQSFTANPSAIIQGNSATITAQFANGVGVIDNGVGQVSSDHSISVAPDTTTVYTLVVTNSLGQNVSQSLTITVNPPTAPQIANFSATPSVITQGQSSNLIAEFSNGTATIDTGIGEVTSGQNVPITPDTSTTYILTVSNSAGVSVSKSISVTVNAAVPQIASFSATPSIITQGQSSNLIAEFSNGTATIDNGIGEVISGQNVPITPDTSTTYTLTVINSAGVSVSQSISVTVNAAAPQIISFTASLPEISEGQSTNLIAEFINGTAVIDNGIGEVTSGQIVTISPNTSTTYTLTVSNSLGQTVSQSLSISVSPAGAAPEILTFAASSASIEIGRNVILSVNFANGDGVIDNGIGAVTPGQNITVNPRVDTKYTLTVTNANGDFVTAQVTIAVVPLPKITAFFSSAARIAAGESVTIQPVFEGGIGVIDLGIGEVLSNQVITVSPTQTTIYYLSVTNSFGTTVRTSVRIAVNDFIDRFEAMPTAIYQGDSTTLNVDFITGSAQIDNGVGSVLPGQIVVTPSVSTTYTLSVSDTQGNIDTRQATVIVQAPKQTPPNTALSPDKLVLAIEKDQAGATYIGGGAIQYVGKSVANAISLDPSTGALTNNYTNIVAPYGDIYTAVSDGAGGWYIGGLFHIESNNNNGLAHVLANGQLDASWAPVLEQGSEVYAIAVNNNDVYVGTDSGLFGFAADTAKPITALPQTQGSIITNSVESLIVHNNQLYMLGTFSSVGDTTRLGLAAINLSDYTISAWYPDISGIRNTLLAFNNSIFIGGNISQANGTTVGGGSVAVDDVDGLTNTWISAPYNGEVYSLTIQGNRVFAGGRFTAGTNNNLAAFNLTDGTLTDWNPVISSSEIRSIASNGNSIYAGGGFYTNLNGSERNFLAAFDAASGTLLPWYANVNGMVRTVAFDGKNVLAGGYFYLKDYKPTSSLVRLLPDGTVDNQFQSPAINGKIYDLAIDGQTLYVGGLFSESGGRKNLIAIDLNTNTVKNWSPNPNNTVATIEIDIDVVYAGGQFTNVYDQATVRNHVAAFNKTDGMPTNWAPNVNSTVYDIALTNSTVIVGGTFGGSVAEFSKTDGVATSFNPKIVGQVYAIALKGNTVYAGGNFSYVSGGLFRHKLAAFNLADGIATKWTPGISGEVQDLQISGDTIYVAGYFSYVGLARYSYSVLNNNYPKRNNLAAFDLIKGIERPWNPNVNGTVWTLLIDGPEVYVGGQFYTVNDLTYQQSFYTKVDNLTGAAIDK